MRGAFAPAASWFQSEPCMTWPRGLGAVMHKHVPTHSFACNSSPFMGKCILYTLNYTLTINCGHSWNKILRRKRQLKSKVLRLQLSAQLLRSRVSLCGIRFDSPKTE